jgi:hypothetical protein
MGKRTPDQRERVGQDVYETPWPTVSPLLSWLRPATRFVEPCAGPGKLARWLKLAGHVCVGCYDLPDDARVKRYDLAEGAIFVTNPPYWGKARELHALIVNLSDQAPLWALLQADWLANLGSGELAPRVRRIVPAGRAKWFEDSPYSGMDNVAWVKFTTPSDAPTIFVFRDPLANIRPSVPRPPKRVRASADDRSRTQNAVRVRHARALPREAGRHADAVCRASDG